MNSILSLAMSFLLIDAEENVHSMSHPIFLHAVYYCKAIYENLLDII